MDFLKFLVKYYLCALLAISSFYVGFNAPYWMDLSNYELVVQIIKH